MANIPLPQEGRDQMPVVVMLRGFVEDEIYSTGLGTRNAANVFAENGFVTLAPDFLGYGESDAPEDDVWWERLNKPVQVMNLLASLDSLPQVDTERVALWGHSNGGQIALSVLEISGKNYPTSLWAPVSKPFPYSVLYYTDEFDDGGLRLRYALAEFERLYEVGNYSIVKYFDLINASILLHQGTEDDEVPLKWSNELVASLKELGKEVEYFVYPGAGHNMEGNWETVVGRDVGFFRQRMKAD
jgi:dipeptidyl aminopeptidase/acylaminoacyl peptidase